MATTSTFKCIHTRKISCSYYWHTETCVYMYDCTANCAPHACIKRPYWPIFPGAFASQKETQIYSDVLQVWCNHMAQPSSVSITVTPEEVIDWMGDVRWRQCLCKCVYIYARPSPAHIYKHAHACALSYTHSNLWPRCNKVLWAEWE